MDTNFQGVKTEFSPEVSVPGSFSYLYESKYSPVLEATAFKLPDPEDFEIPPISPDAYLDELAAQGVSTWPCVRNTLRDLFTPPIYAPAYRCVVILGGTGSAKTTTMECVFGFLADWLMRLRSPMKAMGKREIDTIAMVNMAPTEDQAKKILFTKFKAQVSKNTRFSGIPMEELKRELVFPTKKIRFASGNSSAAFPTGADIFAAVIDECTKFTTQKADPVEELYNILENRRESRFSKYGMIALIGEGGRDNCFAEKLMAMAKSDPTIYARRRSRYDVNPAFKNSPRFEIRFTHKDFLGNMEDVLLHPPEELRHHYFENRAEALRSIDGYPSTADNPFFNFDIVQTLIDGSRGDISPDPGDDKDNMPNEVWARFPADWRGQPGCLYAVHSDLGSGQVAAGKCASGLAMAHLEPNTPKERPIAVLDFGIRFLARPPKVVIPEDVRNFIIRLKTDRSFLFGSVTYDQHQSTDSITMLQNMGFPAERFAVGYEEYATFRSAFYEGRVKIPHDAELLKEIKALEDAGGGSEGRHRAVYPGLGAYKDELDAVVGAVVRCLLGQVTYTKPPVPMGPPMVLQRPMLYQPPTMGLPASSGSKYRSALFSPGSWRR